MADEGLREIQLNGKQLVFLFMASTVVAVVIFLCGVMVGRGVRVLRASELNVIATDPLADPTAPVTSAAPADEPPPATEDGAAPAPSGDEPPLSYPKILNAPNPPEETLEPEKPAPAKAKVVVTPKPAPTKSSSTPVKPVEASAALSKALAEPSGNGFVVQVAAVKERREAETIANRLAGKGYQTFVTTAGTGAARMFRVRVGKFTERRQAQAMANRLQKEEQFKPWITR